MEAEIFTQQSTILKLVLLNSEFYSLAKLRCFYQLKNYKKEERYET